VLNFIIVVYLFNLIVVYLFTTIVAYLFNLIVVYFFTTIVVYLLLIVQECKQDEYLILTASVSPKVVLYGFLQL